ncbi:hypothetical protein NDU88_001849 [Pleurodeles waltl]|uniref:Uncharacterized protein n=1 Tax=Pleurodeles waltl TaxID=8319 RepID=A0AAV7MM46_PLEWA|nr:hypothetical protein NDU88_001849 [Pleurodeles waltl]
MPAKLRRSKEAYMPLLNKDVKSLALWRGRASGRVIEEEMEIQQHSVKIEFAMDITTKLTAIDNHPMNKVLGFGGKYLKKKFSPWIQEHGGWQKAFAVMDEEEVD